VLRCQEPSSTEPSSADRDDKEASLNFEQKVAMIRRAYAPETVDLTLFHPQIEVIDPSRPESADESGNYRGREGVQRYVDEWVESWEQFKLVPQDFIESREKVVVRVRASGRARVSGIELADERFHVFGFRSGKIASLEVHASLSSAQTAGRNRTRVPAAKSRRRP
jgi:ketosteroid isomerase-like protein